MENPKGILCRLDYSDQGTKGKMYVQDPETGRISYMAESLELPWRENKRGVSCIPAGNYKGIWCHSPRYKKHMYLVDGVEGRSGIRIHSANFAGDASMGYKCHLLGCISLGKGWYYKPQLMVHTSRVMIKKFEQFMAGRDFDLIIIGEH